jgi:hypothetical protein
VERLEALEKAQKLNRIVKSREEELNRIAKVHKAARESLEEAVTALSLFLSDLDDDPLPLFPSKPTAVIAEAGKAPTAAPSPKAAPPAKPEPEDDKSWGTAAKTKLADGLKINPVTLTKLDDAKLYTFADLSEYSRKGGKLTDIPGIGEVHAETIRQAEAAFWREQQAELREKLKGDAKPAAPDPAAALVEKTRAKRAAKAGPAAPDPKSFLPEPGIRGANLAALAFSPAFLRKLNAGGFDTVGPLVDFLEKPARGALEAKGLDAKDVQTIMVKVARHAEKYAPPPAPSEAAKLTAESRAKARAAPNGWRHRPVEDLRPISDHMLETLNVKGFTTMGEVIEQGAHMAPWLTGKLAVEMVTLISNFRASLPDAQLFDFDDAMARVEEAAEPKPRGARGRK